jgi:hypothetical protein
MAFLYPLSGGTAFALIVWFGWHAMAGVSIAYLIVMVAGYGIGGGIMSSGGSIIAFAVLAAALQFLKPANIGMLIGLIVIAILIRLGLNIGLAASRGATLNNNFWLAMETSFAITLVVAVALVLLLTPWLRRKGWVDAPALHVAAGAKRQHGRIDCA